MKVIVAGSRSVLPAAEVAARALRRSGFQPTEIVSGAAAGADRAGEMLAESHGWALTKYPADWSKYGKRAGYIRNETMAVYADALVAIWDGQSRGTKHMIDIARQWRIPVHVEQWTPLADCAFLIDRVRADGHEPSYWKVTALGVAPVANRRRHDAERGRTFYAGVPWFFPRVSRSRGSWRRARRADGRRFAAWRVSLGV